MKDNCSEAGAVKIAARIEAYWRRQGRNDVFCRAFLDPGSRVWCVRSNMVLRRGFVEVSG